MNDFFLSDITCRLPEGTQAIGEVLMGALGPYMLFYCPEDHTFLDRATLRDVLESPLSFGLCAMTQESLR